jgi:hypothetical protein
MFKENFQISTKKILLNKTPAAERSAAAAASSPMSLCTYIIIRLLSKFARYLLILSLVRSLVVRSFLLVIYSFLSELIIPITVLITPHVSFTTYQSAALPPNFRRYII